MMFFSFFRHPCQRKVIPRKAIGNRYFFFMTAEYKSMFYSVRQIVYCNNITTSPPPLSFYHLIPLPLLLKEKGGTT
jgi:hypothetical protein